MERECVPYYATCWCSVFYFVSFHSYFMCSWYLRPFFSCFYFVSFYLNYFLSLSESLRWKKSCISCNQWQRYRYFTEWCTRVSFSIQSYCMVVTNPGRYLIPLWRPISLIDLLPLCTLGSSFCSPVPWQLHTAAISRKLFHIPSPQTSVVTANADSVFPL